MKAILNRIIQNGMLSTRQSYWVLGLIIVLTAGVRISLIQAPAIDRTDWKEIDHIMISTNYARHGYHFLQPEISWPAEEPRITAMELPVAPFMASLFYPILGINAFSIRLITLLSFLLLIFYTFKLVNRESGSTAAIIAAVFVAIIPIFNLYGNFLFSEPIILYLSVFTIFRIAEWVDHGKKLDLILAILAFSLTLALKPTALYLALPILFLFYRTHKFQWKKYRSFFVLMTSAMIIPAMWYTHAYHLAHESIDVFGVFGGKFGGHDKFQTFNMLTSKRYYYTMYVSLKTMLFGNIGLIFLMIGVLLSLRAKKGWLFLSYLFTIGCFFIIVAEGNMDTAYRQLTIVPPAAYFMSIGLMRTSLYIKKVIEKYLNTFWQPYSLTFGTFLCVGLLLFYPMRQFDTIIKTNKSIPAHEDEWILAQEIKKVANENKKMVVAGGYTIHKGGNDLSPILYYYSGLQGWSIQAGEWNELEIQQYKNKGADLLAALNYKREAGLEDFMLKMMDKYQVLFIDEERELVLISLDQKNKSTF